MKIGNERNLNLANDPTDPKYGEYYSQHPPKLKTSFKKPIQ